MIFLLLGFIAPAVVCAVLGIMACARRAAFLPIASQEDDDESCICTTSEEWTVASLHRDHSVRVVVPKNRMSRGMPVGAGALAGLGYQENAALETPSIAVGDSSNGFRFGLPPSYSEAMNLSKYAQSSSGMDGRCNSVRHSSSRHLPRNQPRLRPQLSVVINMPDNVTAF